MFRAGRVARCRTDALVVFADQLFVAEVLVRRIAPVDFTHTLMEILRKGFRQTVGKRFHHDFVVIIMLCFKGISQCVLFQPASHGKCADVIRFAGNLRRNEVSETVVSEVDGDEVSVIFAVVGHGTEQLAGLQAGDTVDVLGPLGRGFNLKEDANYILVGGGLGVPPLIYAAQKLAEHDASFATAVFGYRNDHFAEEYVSRYADWSWSIDDAEGNVVDLLNKLEQGDDLKAYDRKPIILSCGPLPMMKAVADWAAERGIPAQLSMEQRMGCRSEEHTSELQSQR